MANFSLNNLFGRRQRSINFIRVKTDYTSAVLDNAINYGLIGAFLQMVAVWGVMGYEYYLLGELNTLGRKINDEGSKVEQAQNRSVEEVSNGESAMRFETKFLATQQKLITYKQLRVDEKMMDLFAILSAIVPEGVRIQTLSIQPHHVDGTFFVSQGRQQNNLPFKQLAANLREVNNATFQDGKKLEIDETDISKISMAADSMGGSGNGYELEVSFNYNISEPARDE